MDLRKYECPECMNIFWVDCDDTDYPEYCPFCAAEVGAKGFIKLKETVEITEK